MDKNLVSHIDEAMKACRNITDKLYKELRDTYFQEKYGQDDSDSFVSLRNALFGAITGEPDFDDFYDRFDAPAMAKGLQPVAWGPRFIPDMIGDVLLDADMPVKTKIKEVQKMHKKCIDLEKKFYKGKKSTEKRS